MCLFRSFFALNFLLQITQMDSMCCCMCFFKRYSFGFRTKHLCRKNLLNCSPYVASWRVDWNNFYSLFCIHNKCIHEMKFHLPHVFLVQCSSSLAFVWNFLLHMLHLKRWDEWCTSFMCLLIELGASFLLQTLHWRFSSLYCAAAPQNQRLFALQN